MSVTTLTHGDEVVRIDAGELVGYAVAGVEYVHQKGSPGWRSADTEMFPVIGPTAEAGFRVDTPRGPAAQDQHGLLRELSYERLGVTDAHAAYAKDYRAGTPVANAKYPAKSTAEFLSWPYDFRFRKTFDLGPDGLAIAFQVVAEAGMPFMLGYHPAFRLAGEAPRIVGEGVDVSLDEVLAVGSRALHVPGVDALEIVDGERRLRIRASGFAAGFMCWTEVRTMVCVEPITFYPYDVPQAELAGGMTAMPATGGARFAVVLTPGR